MNKEDIMAEYNEFFKLAKDKDKKDKDGGKALKLREFKETDKKIKRVPLPEESTQYKGVQQINSDGSATHVIGNRIKHDISAPAMIRAKVKEKIKESSYNPIVQNSFINELSKLATQSANKEALKELEAIKDPTRKMIAHDILYGKEKGSRNFSGEDKPFNIMDMVKSVQNTQQIKKYLNDNPGVGLDSAATAVLDLPEKK